MKMFATMQGIKKFVFFCMDFDGLSITKKPQSQFKSFK